ncbi:IpaC/SipC family type III secretion system effector [Symbiopectobacterium purcellii]|uniref:IpaC/SipC family type III secretion system effector n=1 Tax=Symbiopectobacterium purcellii TaxID=2871826 RepID=A0ABX9AQF8_9ENTR|nr:IpaC/SipC family type III secretion system effector [Symbiopectobacterium purcellii]QZN95240.1 IpaC/SipC family type III secretion system effector [Symbiopectobacterium purcellii]
MMTTLSPVATQNGLNVNTDNTVSSAQPFTLRSPEMLSLADLTSASRSIGDADSAYANTLPVELMLPASTNKAIPSDTKAELAQRLMDSQQGSDIDKIEQVVAGAATLCSAKLLSGIDNPAMRSANEKPGKTAMTNTVEYTAERGRSYAVVDGGTDITPPSPGGYRYSNVMGNMGILDAFTSILQSLNRQEAHFNASAAQWSHVAMASANATGQHLVRSARENQTGAIVSGALSMGMQSVSAFTAGRSLKAESASIENNLKRSNRLNEQAEQAKNSLQNHRDKLVSEGITVEDEVTARLKRAHSRLNSESISLRYSHQQISNTSQKTRIQSDALVQASRSIHDITQGSYGVTAAEQNKDAEIMRANQTVSSEVDNVHQQTAKKSSEGESALRQALLAILNNNNDAVSAVASKMA